MYGGMFVIDWVGVPVSFVATALVYAFVRDMYIALIGGFVVLIPWLWFRLHDVWHVGYAIVVTVAYVVALLPDARQYGAIVRDRRAVEVASQQVTAESAPGDELQQ